jgi:hypothetical protein
MSEATTINAEESPTDAVYEDIAAEVEATPDADQKATSNVWTARMKLEANARSSAQYSGDDLEEALNKLVDEDRVIYWFGLLAPATDEHLDAIIDNEQSCNYPRKILIDRCETLLDGGSTSVSDTLLNELMG